MSATLAAKPPNSPLPPPPPPVLKAEKAPAVEWLHSYEQALALAQKTKRPLLINFHADWCGWCKVMEEEVFAHADLAPLLQKCVCVKVDVDRDRKTAFAFRISSLPRTMFINTHGEIAADWLGYREREKFLPQLQAELDQADKKQGITPLPQVAGATTTTVTIADDASDARLLEFLGHKDPGVRERAGAILVKKGKAALPLLIRGLASDYLGVRIAARKAVQQLKLGEFEFDPWASKAKRDKALAEWRRRLSPSASPE